MKSWFGIVGLFAVFVFVLSIVGAAGNDTSFNVGNCINDVAKVKNTCYDSSRIVLDKCKAEVRNKSVENNWGFFNMQRWKASGLCSDSYKDSMNKCKDVYKSARTECTNKDKAVKAQIKAQKGK